VRVKYQPSLHSSALVVGGKLRRRVKAGDLEKLSDWGLASMSLPRECLAETKATLSHDAENTTQKNASHVKKIGT